MRSFVSKTRRISSRQMTFALFVLMALMSFCSEDPTELTMAPSPITIMVLATAAFCSTELVLKLQQRLLKGRIGQLGLNLFDILLLCLVLLRLVALSYNPFIYFRF